MITTFINQNEKGDIHIKGEEHCLSREEDFDLFLNTYDLTIEEYLNCDHSDKSDEVKEEMKEDELDPDDNLNELSIFDEIVDDINSAFANYGLAFGYCSLGTFNDMKVDYYRYELSTGGPGEEIRFYQDGTIEFVYLNWFCGIGFDVSRREVFEQLEEYFKEIGMMNWEDEREKNGYYEMIAEMEDFED